jgi:hypothetical protein
MGVISISLPANWEAFLKRLADDHEIDVGKVISGICDWAFSVSDSERQFEVWLDKTYPPKGEAEDKAEEVGEDASETEEEDQDKAEEEAHEDRDYSEDREIKSS